MCLFLFLIGQLVCDFESVVGQLASTSVWWMR